jgi:proteasome lid subunit RPN8/RPN11
LEQEIEASGLEIVGVYHSHPDCPAILSKEDEKYMLPGLEYVIMSVQNGEVVDVKSYKKAMPPLNSNNHKLLSNDQQPSAIEKINKFA